MEQQPWTAIASLVISLVAAGVAAMSLHISWRRDRREVAAKEPTAHATVSAVVDQLNWWEVRVVIENRSDYGWRCESIDIRWPLNARGLRREAGRIKNGSGDWVDPLIISPLPLDQASRNIPINATILKAGKSAPKSYGMRMGPGDDHVETLLVFARMPVWLRELSMRVNLVSMEPVERRYDLPIRRTLPLTIKTATA